MTTADASRAFGTLQYIASGQAAALPTSADVFYDLVYSLRAATATTPSGLLRSWFWPRCLKYKDTTNQYLWQPALTAGQPATFMGYGITEAEDMPAVGAGAFSLAFGDFKGRLPDRRPRWHRITRDEITTLASSSSTCANAWVGSCAIPRQLSC